MGAKSEGFLFHYQLSLYVIAYNEMLTKEFIYVIRIHIRVKKRERESLHETEVSCSVNVMPNKFSFVHKEFTVT
jgi:hypothetical protein